MPVSTNGQLTVGDVLNVLEGELLCGEDDLDEVVEDFGATDLLSDVLAMDKEDYVLLTGLTNAQIIRTAEITNAKAVVIVRGKQPQPAAVTLAKRGGVPLILSNYSMFEACFRIGDLAKQRA